MLVASDGTAPAPSDLTVSWPLDTSTPWAGPLIAGGGILMLVGVLLYVLGIRHARRSRGPRRKGLPPLPETQPIDIAVEGSDKGVITAGRPRKAVTRGPARLRDRPDRRRLRVDVHRLLARLLAADVVLAHPERVADA